MKDGAVSTPRRESRLRPAILSVGLAAVFGCGGGTDSRTPGIDGDYVLASVDGRFLPTSVSGGFVTDIVVSGRFEIRGKAVRDIKERRKSNVSTTRVDTVPLTLVRINDTMILTRPSDQPTAEPDTATFSAGVVANGTLTWRTRSAPTDPAGVRSTLVYSRQR
jgi:hypothetical protein